MVSPVPSRADSRAELDDLISRLVDRPGSASISHGADGTSRKGSRPNSVLSASQLSGENTEPYTPSTRPTSQSIAVQTVAGEASVAAGPGAATAAPETLPAPEQKPEVVTYSKAIQTDDLTRPRSDSSDSALESEGEDPQDPTRPSKRRSKKDRERDEEIRKNLRKEIEDEIQATQRLADEDSANQSAQLRYPLRTLEEDELKAVTSSNDFLDFVDRSAKVIERALDEEYDVLADYELGGVDGDMEEDEEHGKKRGIREVCQFWDERWSKKRMISDLSFSPKVRACTVSNQYMSRITQLTGYSSRSSFWPPIPKTLPPPMNQMVSSKSGINICNPDPNMCSTRPQISSLPNSLRSTQISLLGALIPARSCSGTPVRRAQAEVHLCRRHLLLALGTPIQFTAFR